MAVARLAHLTRVEAAQLAADHVLVLPLGSTEQHWTHLPVATDSLAVEAVLDAAIAELGGTVPLIVAPSLAFGSSESHLPHAGTLSLSSETYLAVLKDIMRSAARGGFRRLFLLNGHGGNHELAEIAARDVALEEPLDVGVSSWWLIAREPLAMAGVADAGHAGAFETSVMLAVYPALVRRPLPGFPALREADSRTYRLERHGFWRAIDGVTDSPDRADPEQGMAFLRTASHEVAAALAHFARATDSPIVPRPGHPGPVR